MVIPFLSAVCTVPLDQRCPLKFSGTRATEENEKANTVYSLPANGYVYFSLYLG